MSSLQFLHEAVKSNMSAAAAASDREESSPTFRNNTNFPDGFDLTLLQRQSAKKKSHTSSTVSNQTTKTCAGGASGDEEVGKCSCGSVGETPAPGDRDEGDAGEGKTRAGHRRSVLVVVSVSELISVLEIKSTDFCKNSWQMTTAHVLM